MKKRSPLGTLRNKCDKLMQEINKKNNKKCFICPNKCQVAHHFIPKSVSARLRYDWDNLIPLCNACHMRLHQSGDPSYEYNIIKKKGDNWFELLQEKKQEIIKVNKSYYENKLEELNATT